MSEEGPSWMNVVVRVGLNAATHPLDYGKLLIQIGHEPLPTYKSCTLFGREQLFYPSIFSYIKHIKKTDGLSGCYRGLTPKILANVVSGMAATKVAEAIPIQNDEVDSADLSIEERTLRFVKRSGRETLAKGAAILVSQPFHVIAVRTMAEFVGHDGIYTGLFTSVGVIYREDGIFGFFAGFVPRLVGEIGALWVSNALIHVLNNYVIEDKSLKVYVQACVKFICSSLWYPMQVVSTCMAVSNSGLTAGNPPCMPHYSGWLSCYSHLKSSGCVKRGSTLIWRRYTGPLMLASDGLVQQPSHIMFASPLKFD